MTDIECFKVIKLKPHHVFRFKCETDAKLLMSEGTAEIFGSEFPLNVDLKLPKAFNADLITFSGCKLQFQESNFKYYIFSFHDIHNCWNIYLNIHASLEKLRQNASNMGPRVMICGNKNSGKKNLSQTLINYRIRKYGKIIYIDANTHVNHICIPTSLAALVVTEPYNITDGWNISDEPLIFNFGSFEPLSDPDLYMFQLKALSDFVDNKLDNNPDLNQSGFILNMSSLEGDSQYSATDEQRLALFQETIDLFQINYVIVIEDGFLAQSLKRRSSSDVSIIKVPKSSESTNLNNADLLEMYQFKVSAYFKGQGFIQLRINGFRINAKSINIYRFESSETKDPERFKNPKLMKLTKYFRESYLAVSQATDIADLAKMPIYGYVMITEISQDLSSFRIITPSGEPAPSKLFLFTEFKIAF